MSTTPPPTPNHQTVFPPLWFVAMLKDAEDEHRYLLAARSNPAHETRAGYLDDAKLGIEWAMIVLKRTPPAKGEGFAAYVSRLKSVIETQATEDPWASDPGAADAWRAGVQRVWRKAVCGVEAVRNANGA